MTRDLGRGEGRIYGKLLIDGNAAQYPFFLSISSRQDENGAGHATGW